MNRALEKAMKRIVKEAKKDGILDKTNRIRQKATDRIVQGVWAQRSVRGI